MIRTATEDEIVEALERAAELATAGDVAAAGELAVEAARHLPPGDADRLDTFVFAAQLLARGGRHLQAAEAWAAAAEEAGEDATTARLLSAAGDQARLAGRWDAAVHAHTRALSLAEQAIGETVDTAAIAQNLAMVFKYTGRFDDAEQLYNRALSIAEAAGEQRLVATICHNLGGLAHARGDTATGIPWARRSAEVRAAVDPPDLVALAGDRGALAGLLIESGDLDEAADLLHAARRVFVEQLGGDHHEVAVIDGNLATIALRRGDDADAERHARAALANKERALGATHPELAVTLTTLGTIRRRLGHPDEAARLHRRALELLRPAVEPDHPLLRTIQANLAVAHHDERAAPNPNRRTPKKRPQRRR